MYRAEPKMLKILPIIPAGTSQKSYPLFLFYSHIITYYSQIILFAVIVPGIHIQITGYTLIIKTTQTILKPLSEYKSSLLSSSSSSGWSMTIFETNKSPLSLPSLKLLYILSSPFTMQSIFNTDYSCIMLVNIL